MFILSRCIHRAEHMTCKNWTGTWYSRIYVLDFEQCQFNYSSGLPFVAPKSLPLSTLTQTRYITNESSVTRSLFSVVFPFSHSPKWNKLHHIHTFLLSIFSSAQFLSRINIFFPKYSVASNGKWIFSVVIQSFVDPAN